MEIVRLAGTPGSGKTTAGWLMARADAVAGLPVAFIDMDQLGMCYPAPEGDADRWMLKERALRRIAPTYEKVGAARLIVAGVASPELPPPLNSDYPTHSFWLDAPENTRRKRLAERGWTEEETARVAALGSAESARADANWVRVDTHGRTASQSMDDIRNLLTAPLFQLGGEPDWDSRILSDPPRALWLSGPRVVGTSTIGWAVARGAWSTGRRTGFMDVGQLGFAWNVRRAVGATNAGELGRVFAEAGATDLVIVAPLGAEASEARGRLSAARLTEVRVTANASARCERIRSRREGRGPVLAGDDVFAASDASIETMFAAGAAQAAEPLHRGEHLLDTSRLSPVDAAVRLRAIAEW